MTSEPTLFDAKENRNAVFAQIQDRLSASRMRVFNALFELGRATDQQIKEKLGVEINIVTGRRRELCEMKLVKNVGEEIGPYRQPRTVWEIDYTQLTYFLNQIKRGTHDKKLSVSEG